MTNQTVKGWFIDSPIQEHIAQEPMEFLSDINRSIDVGIVFTTNRTDELSLCPSPAFIIADMAELTGIGFIGFDNSYAQHLGFIFNHLSEFEIGHTANNPVEPSASGSLPDSLEVSKDYARIGRISEADYFLADFMEDVVYTTPFLISNPCYNLIETSLLQSFSEPVVMPSYSPNLPAEELGFHHIVILQNHRSCSNTLSKIHSEDRGINPLLRSIKFKAKHSNIFTILFNKLAFSKSGIFREWPVWFIPCQELSA